MAGGHLFAAVRSPGSQSLGFFFLVFPVWFLNQTFPSLSCLCLRHGTTQWCIVNTFPPTRREGCGFDTLLLRVLSVSLRVLGSTSLRPQAKWQHSITSVGVNASVSVGHSPAPPLPHNATEMRCCISVTLSAREVVTGSGWTKATAAAGSWRLLLLSQMAVN